MRYKAFVAVWIFLMGTPAYAADIRNTPDYTDKVACIGIYSLLGSVTKRTSDDLGAQIFTSLSFSDIQNMEANQAIISNDAIQMMQIAINATGRDENKIRRLIAGYRCSRFTGASASANPGVVPTPPPNPTPSPNPTSPRTAYCKRQPDGTLRCRSLDDYKTF